MLTGNKTGKRVIAWLICFAMLLGITNGTSLTVYAQAGDLVIAGVDQDSESNCSGDGWSYVASTHTLTLDGFSCSYTGDDTAKPQSVISYDGTEALTIEVKGNNSISGTDQGITCGAVTLKGTGSLTVDSETFCITCSDLVIESGDYSFTALYDGVYATTFTMNGGNVKAIGKRCNGLQIVGLNAFVKLNGGKLIAEGKSNGSGDMSSGIYCYDLRGDGENQIGNVTICEGCTLIAGAGTNVAEQEQYVAIYGNTINNVAGKGWMDYTGAGAASDIAVNTTGAALSFKKIQFPADVSSEIPVTGVALGKTSLSLEKGKTETLTATVTPDNATDKTVTWDSSNKAVATVDGGKVTAVAAGKTTITATAGGKSATCEVTVTETSATGGNSQTGSQTTGGDQQETAKKIADLKPGDEVTVASTDSAAKVGTFTLNKDGKSVKLSEVNKKSKKLVVPASITNEAGEKVPVTEIDPKAFNGCAATTIDISKIAITKLVSKQFAGAKNATEIKINGKKLKAGKINKNFLKGLSKLKTVKIVASAKVYNKYKSKVTAAAKKTGRKKGTKVKRVNK